MSYHDYEDGVRAGRLAAQRDEAVAQAGRNVDPNAAKILIFDLCFPLLLTYFALNYLFGNDGAFGERSRGIWHLDHSLFGELVYWASGFVVFLVMYACRGLIALLGILGGLGYLAYSALFVR